MRIIKTSALFLSIITIASVIYKFWFSLTTLIYLPLHILMVSFMFILNIWFNGGSNSHHPDLSGKVIVITGANTGLGYESCRAMAKLNPKKIILACRSEERATKAILKIKEEINVDILEFMRLDLNDLHTLIINH